jgi:SAM-dependent MidA family methyltransferase
MDPGERDLTVHVDFESLARAARDAGAGVHGPVAQGEWLIRLGIDARVLALTRRASHRAEEVSLARRRLVSPGEMGTLFRVLGLSAPGWPEPEGFS